MCQTPEQYAISAHRQDQSKFASTLQYNNDQLVQIIGALEGEDLNKISQALEALYKSNRETYQLFVALNGIDNQILTVLCHLTTLKDISADTILLGGVQFFSTFAAIF
ncbi:hypothetical protein BLNAU_24589 [Blattamonas nauphoetae]|uniref:Uncharacterized protein n=1 Tax=Blattamonas nauphoetae TaxID=2049346 RepID=A0ABQ9WM16_9EUKA|nr:hypothetical protein BLNAU_24589 [Blattamonas nauphoetae]